MKNFFKFSIKVCLILLVPMALSLSTVGRPSSPNKICALDVSNITGQLNPNVFYQGNNSCQVRELQICPEGYMPSSKQIFGESDDITDRYCIPKSLESEFCRIVTGNSAIYTGYASGESGGGIYCSSPPLPTIGSCDADGDFKFTGVSDADTVLILDSISPSFYSTLEYIMAGTAEEVAIGNTSQVLNYLSNTTNPGGNSNLRYKGIRCYEHDVNGRKRTVARMPAVLIRMLEDSSGDRINSIEKYHSEVAAQELIYKAKSLGMVIERKGDINNGADTTTEIQFCPGANSIYLFTRDRYFLGINNQSSHYCIENIQETGTQRPCYFDVEAADSPGDKKQVCILGYKQGNLPSNGNPIAFSQSSNNVNQIFGTGDASQSNFNSTIDFVQAPNSPLCALNSKDVLLGRSNKGCGEYISVTSGINQVYIAPENQNSYLSCAKCLYGENPTLYNLSLEDAVPTITNLQTGTQFNPTLEPLMIPIPGRVYNELGCIGTSDTSSIVNTIIRIALGLMGGVVIIRIIQGALTMQTADPEQIAQGRGIVISAIVGLMVLILSAAILNFIGINLLQFDVDNGRGFTVFGP